MSYGSQDQQGRAIRLDPKGRRTVPQGRQQDALDDPLALGRQVGGTGDAFPAEMGDMTAVEHLSTIALSDTTYVTEVTLGPHRSPYQ